MNDNLNKRFVFFTNSIFSIKIENALVLESVYEILILIVSRICLVRKKHCPMILKNEKLIK